MSVLNLFFGFSGRINRGKYWLALVVWFLIWIIAVLAFLLGGLAILGANLTEGALPSPQDTEAFLHLIRDYGVLFLVILTFVIITWFSGVAIGVKRLHDRDRSGWWILVFYFGPGVLAGLQASTEGDIASLVLGLATFVVSIWGLIELGFLRGTSGPNRFGPDPLKHDIAVATTLGASKPAA
jgi:uncharacterized membrane protein YhaH (DUF805 family)